MVLAKVTTSLALGRGKHLKILKEIKFPHSLGLYILLTYYLGFKVILENIKLWVWHMVNQNIQI